MSDTTAPSTPMIALRTNAEVWRAFLADSPMKRAASVVAVIMALYHLWTGYDWLALYDESLTGISGQPIPEFHYPMHLMLAFAVLFLGSEPNRGSPAARARAAAWNLLLLGVTVAACGYLVLNTEYIQSRLAYIEPLLTHEYVLSLALLLVVFEAARRVVGMPMTIITVLFIIYAIIGGWLPPPFWHRGFALERILDWMYFTNEAMWSTPVAVTAGYIYLYVLFGSLLAVSGAGDLFADLAHALTGRYTGGPAKTAIVGSYFMGMLSGSAAANVVTTGTFTIPTMKSAGYPAEYAGGVEAVASSGGQLTPPVMGAAAFVMAEFTGVSYGQIVIIAAIPALLYYFALFCSVDFEARLLGLKPDLSAPVKRVSAILRKRGYLIGPVAVLIYFLVEGYTPATGASWTILFLILMLAIADPENRGRIPAVLWEAAQDAAYSVAPITVACALGGMIAGVFAMTGLGVRLSSIIVDASMGSLFLLLVLTMLFAVFLGMGMPTTGTYIVLSVLLAPAMEELKVSTIAAHMFIFWGACKSSITPPVALASFAAAAVAGTDPWKTSITAFRLGLSVFLIPFMFAYQPELLAQGALLDTIWRVAMACLGIATLSTATSRWCFAPITGWMRLAAVPISGLFIVPAFWTDIAALVLATIAGGYCWVRAREMRRTNDPRLTVTREQRLANKGWLG